MLQQTAQDWRAVRFGLSRIAQLLHMAGDPDKGMRYVHITGTNGKGSTAAMVAGVLQQAGYRTGLFTSPHIQRFGERIKVNGEEISTDVAMLLVFNGRSAGRFKLAPNAQVDDGMLDILILDYENKAKTCVSMMNYLIGGKDEKVRSIRSNKVELHCDMQERTDIDGQPGPNFPLCIECLKGHLKVRL